jgi:7-cyano-7-deazaguanine tRNA-ribosyltransferase
MNEFEIRERDLLARIGRLKTKSGTVETPAFLPVINSSKVTVTPKELWADYGCRMLITNAYIIKKRFGDAAKERGVHGLLDFPGVVMTDSGAYQILAYGHVEVAPEEIVSYQEEIGSDVATILDIPTDWKVSKEQAEHTVEETIRRAKALESQKSRDDILWVGPVQGGRYLELVAASAKEMAALPFEVHALGSPTPVMEQYLFDLLVDMVLAAKMSLPPERPFHLFGAGHPFMFGLAVALGCDLFDSAAYSLFAREDRYLTTHGTVRLERLEYLPCSCSVCAKRTPKDLAEMPKDEREKALSRHNLHVCFAEMKSIKQAIVEGRMWEHLEMRAHGHPALLQALKQLQKYGGYIEQNSPVTKRSGLFFYGALDLARPEVVRYEKRLLERYTPPQNAKALILIPDMGPKPVRRARRCKKAVAETLKRFGLSKNDAHICVYAPPFGVIPPELKAVYPLSQYEFAYPPDRETNEYVARQIAGYVAAKQFERSVLLVDVGTWQEEVAELCGRICAEKGVKLEIVPLDK